MEGYVECTHEMPMALRVAETSRWKSETVTTRAAWLQTAAAAFQQRRRRAVQPRSASGASIGAAAAPGAPA